MKAGIKRNIRKLLTLLVHPLLGNRINALQDKVNYLFDELHVKPFVANPKYFNEAHIPKEFFDYASFSLAFRDSKLIKDWQSFYIRFLEKNFYVLDVGCGNGEFLELLMENGIKGIGVDLDSGTVNLCIEKGLNVLTSDVIPFLNNSKKEAFNAIFAAHVIEHMPLEQLDRFFKLCWSRLKENGILIIETPNPHRLAILKIFYVDPTHIKPVFPELCKFLFLSNGFGSLETFFVNPNNKTAVREEDLNNELYTSGEYAIVGRKHKFFKTE